MLFVLGMFGALATAYFSIGEYLPAMGGGAEYTARRSDLRALHDRMVEVEEGLEEVAEKPDLTDVQMRARGELLVHLGDRFETESRELEHLRRRSTLTGSVLYVVLGGFVAAAIASSNALAVILGAGWTVAASRIGIGKEIKTTKELQRAALAEALAQPWAGGMDPAKKADEERAQRAEARAEELETVLTTVREQMAALMSAAADVPSDSAHGHGSVARRGSRGLGHPRRGEQANLRSRRREGTGRPRRSTEGGAEGSPDRGRRGGQGRHVAWAALPRHPASSRPVAPTPPPKTVCEFKSSTRGPGHNG